MNWLRQSRLAQAGPGIDRCSFSQAQSQLQETRLDDAALLLLSMLLLAGVFAFNASRGQAANSLGFEMVLLCPLKHLLRIPLFMGKKK